MSASPRCSLHRGPISLFDRPRAGFGVGDIPRRQFRLHQSAWIRLQQHAIWSNVSSPSASRHSCVQPGAEICESLEPETGTGSWSSRDLVAMSLLASSKPLMASPAAAFGLLLIATGALGFGFGATVMALNTYAQNFFPQNPDRAVLALNALLGTGTALAPLFVSILLGLGVWWALPILVACALALILPYVLKEPLQIASSGAPGKGGSAGGSFRQLPPRFWLYAASVFLYGIVETLNGNWAALYLGLQRGVSAQGASLALTSFWATVTIGRVLFAALSARAPVRWTYVTLPALLVIAFQVVSRASSETAGILAFGFAGMGCSAFLPLSISFGSDEFPKLTTMMSGELIAFYQLGYGVAAFGTGPLRNFAGLPFSSLYSYGSAVSAVMGVLAWFLIRRNSGSR